MASKIRKIYYNKLIRDKIPQVMESRGARYKIRRLSLKHLKIELLKKVVEEASGLLNSKTRDEIADGLGDVLAVINEIKKVFKITDREINLAMKNAFAKKGGFKKKLYLIWSEDTGYRTNERRYVKK